MVPARVCLVGMRDCRHRQGQDGSHHAVLVVDDDEQVAALAADYIAHDGDSVETTAETNQAAALAYARADEIDCLVTDYHMPGLTGLELCSEIQEIDPHLPCVVFTSDDSTEIERRTHAADLQFVHKGAGLGQLEELASTVERVLDRADDAASRR